VSIIGLLPIGGLGTRLGLPFPKALAPTFTSDGIQPLYAHAYDRLRRVADRIVFVLGEHDDPCLADLPGERRLAARAGLSAALREGATGLRPDDICAVALPDSMWWPSAGFGLALHAYRNFQPVDGVLLTFDGSSHVLDPVTTGRDGFVTAIERHTDPPVMPRNVRGWGAFVASAGCLRGLDDGPLGPQLAEYRFKATHLGSDYYDLGTPKRYEANVSRPKHMDPDQ